MLDDPHVLGLFALAAGGHVELDALALVEGTVGIHKARLALLNPTYRLLG